MVDGVRWRDEAAIASCAQSSSTVSVDTGKLSSQCAASSCSVRALAATAESDALGCVQLRATMFATAAAENAVPFARFSAAAAFATALSLTASTTAVRSVLSSSRALGGGGGGFACFLNRPAETMQAVAQKSSKGYALTIVCRLAGGQLAACLPTD